MRVRWTEHALVRRDRIANYIGWQFGARRKVLFLQQVRQITRLLRQNPNLGTIDPLYADRPATYRSVIIGSLSKMVYRTDGDVIHIVGFWDTRQEPQAQAVQTE